MPKSRMEAFSDGVIAIIITIMVLEFKVPHSADLAALRPLGPAFLSYLLSYVYLGIYWNNHHHLIHIARRVSGGVLWANLHLLLWLSLIPFLTGWMGENHFAAVPTACYGMDLFLASIAFLILQRAIIRADGGHSPLARAIGTDWKGKISAILYAAAIGSAFVNRWVAGSIYAGVAVIWLIPDRRIERAINSEP